LAFGAVAQLGERLVCNQEATGSIPVSSTNFSFGANVIQYAYKELFPVGTKVRVVDRVSLIKFKETWKYHHKLETEQLDYADRIATVKKVGFYHGGDVVYELTDIPGVWLEPCLSPA
jgi:hypothetical protein